MGKKDLDLLGGDDDERSREEAGELKKQEREETDGNVEERRSTGNDLKAVDVDEESEEEDEDRGQEQRPPRRERRANRYAEQKRSREEAEARSEELRRQNEMLQAQLAQSAAIREIAERIPKQQQADPDDAEIEELQRQRNEIYSLHESKMRAGTLTAEDQAELQKRVNALMRKENTIIVRRELRANQQQGAQHQQNGAQAAVVELLKAQHPDVWDNERARNLAILSHRRLVAMGHPDNLDTFAEAADQTRKDLRLPARGQRQPYRPNGHTRRAMSGVSAGGSGAGGQSRRVVEPTKANIAMARGAYPKLWKESPQKAFAKWAKESGADDGED